MKQGTHKWNACTLLDLLTHIHTNYAAMNGLGYNTIMIRFAEPPNMDLLVDTYFMKQDKCQILASDSDNHISDTAMVLQLTTHM